MLSMIISPIVELSVSYSSSIIAVYGQSEERSLSSASTGKDIKNHVSWLRDILPHKFPFARIMTYNYSLVTGHQDFISVGCMRKAARELLREVSRGRRVQGQAKVVSGTCSHE